MSRPRLLRLAAVAALATVADAAVTVAARWQFAANLDTSGWVLSDDPPYDGTKQRFAFCIAVAVLVAVAGVAAALLLRQARPGARLAVVYALPACVVVNLFTVVYGPGNLATNSRGESATDHAETAAAVDRLFPLWFTGGHALLVVLLGVLALRLVLLLRRPEHRDFYEYAGA